MVNLKKLIARKRQDLIYLCNKGTATIEDYGMLIAVNQIYENLGGF